MTIQSTSPWAHRTRGRAISSIAASAVRWLSRAIVAHRERRRRRAAIRELQRWSDQMLSDIGLTRGMIPGVVDGLMQRDTNTPAESRPARSETAAERRIARPPQYSARAAGLSVVQPLSPKAECC